MEGLGVVVLAALGGDEVTPVLHEASPHWALTSTEDVQPEGQSRVLLDAVVLEGAAILQHLVLEGNGHLLLIEQLPVVR